MQQPEPATKKGLASGPALVDRIGLGGTMLLVTVCAVAASVAITRLLLLPLPATPRIATALLWISIGVPLLVAPATAWLVGQIMLRTEAARREAEQLATTDALTGVWNRRHFFALGGSELARASGGRDSVALMLLDIDRFKAVNDMHGHAAGDAVLQAVAAACGERLRPYDLLARLGGEEFVILLSAVDEAQAMQAAERVRGNVEALSVAVAGGVRVRPTISIGVSLGRRHGDTLDALLDAADRAMYAAKNGGRNRACLAGATAVPARAPGAPQTLPGGLGPALGPGPVPSP